MGTHRKSVRACRDRATTHGENHLLSTEDHHRTASLGAHGQVATVPGTRVSTPRALIVKPQETVARFESTAAERLVW
jgi:hypothetical protein